MATRYVEIANELRRRITEGTYLPDERLPPVEDLAKDFQVSRVSISRSYRLLKRDTLIYTTPAGTFVRPKPPTT